MPPPKNRKKIKAESFPQASLPTSRPSEDRGSTSGSLNQAFALVDALDDQAPSAGGAPILAAGVPLSSRSIQAQILVHRSLLLASGSGMLPMPLLDALFITATQIRMTQKLADLYDVSFTLRRGKWLISSLGGYAVNTASLIGAASFSKMIPGVGTLLGVTSMTLVAGAFTYALGVVLIRHFESEGDLDDFDPEEHRACFQEEFTQAAQCRK